MFRGWQLSVRHGERVNRGILLCQIRTTIDIADCLYSTRTLIPPESLEDIPQLQAIVLALNVAPIEVEP